MLKSGRPEVNAFTDVTKRVFVGGLNYSTTEEALKVVFASYGTIRGVKIVRDRKQNNKSKGFGFVEFSSSEEAKTVINSLNGAEIDGRKITVSQASQNIN